MPADGLFEFPCDEIYGIHNTPNGRAQYRKGLIMAGACS